MPKMTLSLPDSEWDDLGDTALDASLSKTAVIRQALRAYIRLRRFEKKGDKIMVADESGEQRFQVTFL